MATLTKPLPLKSSSFSLSDQIGNFEALIDSECLSKTEAAPSWRSMASLTLTQATDLLDLLEAHGIEKREVTAERSGLLTVRWC